MKNEQNRLWTDPEQDPVQVAAADWVGRLSNSDVTVEETLAWQEWMKADPRQAQAFQRMEQISRSLKLLEPPSRPWKWQLEHDDYDASVPLSEWCDSRVQNGRARKARLAAAAAVVLMMAAGAWAMLATRWGTSPSAQNVVVTGIGENRSIGLADGSTVTLGGDSRLEWAFSESERSLELAQGEALFKVAKDVARPFKVRAGDATVVALGTAFNVRRTSDHTVVAVTDGRVVVEPVTRLLPMAVLRELKPKLRPVHLDAGEQTTAGSAGIEKASKLEDVAAATSWQTGRLSFRLQPLRYVLEDVNRYAQKPIVAADDRVGTLIVSGTVIGDNVGGWVESLEHAFGLVAIEEDERIVLRAR